MQGDAQAPIERSLFRRAMTDLLHNAIRHSQTRSVSNHDPEIPSQHPGRLFDRFCRVDMARTNSDESHGLGLAIVKAVAAMHAGDVFATSRDGMTTAGFSVSTGA